MNWNLPFVTRSAHQAALAEIERLHRRVLDTEARHDEVEGKRRRLARMLAEADAANRRLNGSSKELRRRLDAARDGQLADADAVTRLTVEHAAHRQAIAAALGADPHLDWEQLAATARRTREALGERTADCEAEKKRADSLEQHGEVGRLKRRIRHLEKQVDDATGLPEGRDWRLRGEAS